MARKRRRRRNRNRNPNYYATNLATEKQLRNRARRLAEATIRPQRRSLLRESRLQGQALTGFTEALADELGAIAPGVQAGYDTAAKTQAAFSRGLADGQAMLQQQAGQQNADFVGLQGGDPNTVSGIGAGASEVSYGLGGYAPASALNQQGAAFGAVARMLPGTSARQGQENLASLQANTRSELGELNAQIPGLAIQAYEQMGGNEIQKYGARLNAQALGLDRAEFREQKRQNRREFRLGLASLALDQAKAAADAASDNDDDRADGRKERMDLWFDSRDGMRDLAEKMHKQENLGDRRPKSGRVFRRLMAAYADDLRRAGFSNRLIRRLVIKQMVAAGFKRPPRPLSGHANHPDNNR